MIFIVPVGNQIKTEANQRGITMEEKMEPPKQIKRFEQLCILVLDGSGSMGLAGESGQAKAEEVKIAVQGLISTLKGSRAKDNFYLSIVTYDDKVNKNRLKPTPVTQVDILEDYNPLNGHGGETAIGDALEAAGSIAEEFLVGQQNVPRTSVIVLMTDGQSNCGKDPFEVANTIKTTGKRITICAAGYGKEEVDEGILKMIVNEGKFKRTRSAEELRKFFEESSQTIKKG